MNKCGGKEIKSGQVQNKNNINHEGEIMKCEKTNTEKVNR